MYEKEKNNYFNLLNNISVKMKLVLILTLPIVGLLFFSSLQSFDYYKKYSTMQKIEKVSLLSQKISKLVHELQKERGLTAAYLSSKGKDFKRELILQRTNSDLNYENFLKFKTSINFEEFPNIFSENINKVINYYSSHDKIRKEILSLNIKTPRAINFYSTLNSMFLNNVELISKLSKDVFISRELLSYVNFLFAKEQAGLERAIGANILAENSFTFEKQKKFINLIKLQDVYTKIFLNLSKEEAKTFYKKTFLGNDIDAVNKIRKQLLSSPAKHNLINEMIKTLYLDSFEKKYLKYFQTNKTEDRISAITKYEVFLSLLSTYEKQFIVSKEEKKLLTKIKNNFFTYKDNLDNNNFEKTSFSNNQVILQELSSSLYSVSSKFWFSQISSKINKLKIIDDKLSSLLIKNVKNAKDLVFESLILTICASLFSLLFALIFGFIVTRRIALSLNILVAGLDNFFEFLNYKTEDAVLLKVLGTDEFGKMTMIINENITKTKENIFEDRKVIDDTIKISNRVNMGFFDGKIICTSSNPSLNELKDILNTMVFSLNSTFVNIKDILYLYSTLDYHSKVKKDNKEGILAELIDSINNLGETITKDLVNTKTNGLTLEKSANTLLENVENLTTSSTTAAASLEETAAALDEILSTTNNNTLNVAQMTKYASSLMLSAKEGEELALNTMKSMDEINSQVVSISESIVVIDQITFQTNILSLNAAVEAATAGEAGKGFAVVAQEVRNLASRSADAAKEIKEIVVFANNKAQEGKIISENMLDGYKKLNLDIGKTLDLIKDIDIASKEQQLGIEQINDSISKLDQQTQMNASSALETNDIAISTQKLSYTIIQEVNKKEFKGKDLIS